MARPCVHGARRPGWPGERYPLSKPAHVAAARGAASSTTRDVFAARSQGLGPAAFRDAEGWDAPKSSWVTIPVTCMNGWSFSVLSVSAWLGSSRSRRGSAGAVRVGRRCGDRRSVLNSRSVSTAEERRRIRQQQWGGGVARSFAEMEQADLEFWLTMEPADRLRMVWSLVEDSLALQGSHGPSPRLQRLVGGVRPLRR